MTDHQPRPEGKRPPLTEEQARINSAALAVFPKLIHPEDPEMEEVCDSLVERGSLVAVYEGPEGDLDPEADLLVRYQASEELRAAMLIRSTLN